MHYKHFGRPETPSSDREQYTLNNKNLFEIGMQDPEHIDFNRFNIDIIIEEERKLIPLFRKEMRCGSLI
jgi:hypothetical protein